MNYHVTPIIHVGLHKTGTTFLQKKVFPNFKKYKLFTRPYTQHNHAFNQLQYSDDSLYNKSVLEEEISLFDTKKILLSDESFSGKPTLFSHINRSLIAKRFSEIFPNATIIIFLRSQYDMLRSLYNQYIKMGGVLNIDEFVWYPKQNYSFAEYQKEYENNNYSHPLNSLFYNTNQWNVNLEVYKYHELLNLYHSYFKNVEIFLYEDLLLEKKKVLQRLERIFGEILPKDLKSEKARRVNASIKNIKLHQINNKWKYIQPKIIYSFVKRLVNSIPDFSRDHVEEELNDILEYYNANNKKVLESYGDKINAEIFSKFYLI